MLEFVGDIRLFAGGTPPRGWLFCDGQLLPVLGDYEPLFSILKTTFGGDGQNNFALPKLPPLIENVQYMMCVLGAYPQLDGTVVPRDRGTPEDFMTGYLGEIRVFAGFKSFERWIPCEGQLIVENKTPGGQNVSDILYEYILGNKFGGTDANSYGLPNLYKPGAPLAYYICIEGEFPSPG
jgi:microcystin-dependent protein